LHAFWKSASGKIRTFQFVNQRQSSRKVVWPITPDIFLHHALPLQAAVLLSPAKSDNRLWD